MDICFDPNEVFICPAGNEAGINARNLCHAINDPLGEILENDFPSFKITGSHSCSRRTQNLTAFKMTSQKVKRNIELLLCDTRYNVMEVFNMFIIAFTNRFIITEIVVCLNNNQFPVITLKDII